MKNVVRAAVLGISVSFALAPVARAAEPAPASATPAYKVGDKVWICGCGKACKCNTLEKAAGKCHCGKELIEATVTKVDGNAVTVKSANGEQTLTTGKV